ncbi:MAG TPA: ABC transporter permease, partial [Paenibacillus sp.]|uniref:ABC transporter permease n=1 Tax=Paenibacillus sp. TaxID=58172 RepID=UPI002C9E646E
MKKDISISPYYFFNPIYFFKHFWQHQNLIRQFTIREIQLKYRGSFLGIIWSFLNPILMLAVYSFVFSVIFEGKWRLSSNNQFEFSIILFSGLILFGIFTECLNKSPSVVSANVNYVKKVVFPLEILPLVNLITSLAHAMISMVILLIAINLFLDFSSWQVVLSVFSLIPMLMLTLGFSFLISALGVYIKDIAYTVVVFTNILVYLTPVFYPISAVPQFMRDIMYFNPLTMIVENFRNVIIWSNQPSWSGIIIVMIISYTIMVLGLIIFKKLESGFSDI